MRKISPIVIGILVLFVFLFLSCCRNGSLPEEPEEKIKDYSKILKKNPNDVISLNNRAGTYYENGQYLEAIEDYSKAIQLNPDITDFYINRGLAYVRE